MIKLITNDLLIVLILSIHLMTYSQSLSKKLTNTQSFKVAPESKIDNVFFLGDELVVSTLNGERYDKRTHGMLRNFSITKENGTSFNLVKNEHPVEIINNHLYTVIEDVANQGRTYNVYELSENGLIKKSSSDFSLDSTVHIMKNGQLIITEGGHSGRDWVRLYDKELNKIHEFRPFNDECNILYDANGELIAYVGQIDTDPKIRLAFYAAFANNGMIGTQEIEIDPNYILSSVKLVNDRLVILLSNVTNAKTQLLIIDRHFEITKKIDLQERVSYNKIVPSSRSFFINTYSSVSSYDIETGLKKWSHKKVTSKPTKTKYGYKFKGTNIFGLEDGRLLLVEANYEDNVDLVKDVTLKLLDSSADSSNSILQEIKTNKDFSGELRVKNLNKHLVIYGANDFTIYEK